MINWLRRRRGEKTEPQQEQDLYELREFIYLDEVSVTSLLSSREGAIPHEFTDSTGSSTKADVNAQIDASAAVLKGRIGSRYESARSVNSQVVSKATVQTLFKRLHDIERNDLALKSSRLADKLPSQSSINTLVSANEYDPSNRRWITPVKDLRRGELVELEVELETDEIFQLSTTLATFKELSDEHEDLRAQIGQAGIAELVSINKVIEKMMVGLIPLKCCVVDYLVAETQHGKKLIHQSAYDMLDADNKPPVKPLYLVGDTEQSLFWKDIRRVLFSGSRFRMLCRLNRDGLNASWNPLKLADTLKRVDPDLGSRLATFGELSVAAMSDSATGVTRIEELRATALQTYGHLLANHAGYVLSPGELSTVTLLAQSQQPKFTSALQAREAFEPVRELVEGLASTSFDRELAARLREEACETSGLLPDGEFLQPEQVTLAAASTGSSNNLLDVEVIAIYW